MQRILELPLKITAPNLDSAIEEAISQINEYDKSNSQKWRLILLSIHFLSNKDNTKEYWFNRVVIG